MSSTQRDCVYEISFCSACALPLEACRCEPEDWTTTSAGALREPPTVKRRVVLADERPRSQA